MKHPATVCAILIVTILLSGCVASGRGVTPAQPGAGGAAPSSSRAPGTYEVFGKSYRVLPDSRGYLEIGIASWYGRKFHGKLTANGERYNMYRPSAAHRTLPLPTFVKVTNLNNRKHMIVRVNDRGPFHSDRVIDLSYKAALELDFIDTGTAPVVVEALDYLNYPDEVAAAPEQPTGAASEHHHLYYLQLGAFRERGGAERLLRDTHSLMSRHNRSGVQIKILSEEHEESILHKVWMGPLGTEEEQEAIVALVEDAELARPIRVQVD